MRYVKQPPFLKSQSSKIVPYLQKKRFKPISVSESKRVDKIKSGVFYASVNVKMTSLMFLRNWPFLSKRILILKNV